MALARRTEQPHSLGQWIASESDPEGSFSELVRVTTLSTHGSGWISWEPHEGADTIRTDRVITFSPHRHFPIGHDEPWAEAAIGIGRIIARPGSGYSRACVTNFLAVVVRRSGPRVLEGHER